MSGNLILYKFMPLTKVERLLDVLINERLYCAPYAELNDPYEGQFIEEVTIETNGPFNFLIPFAPNGMFRNQRGVDFIAGSGAKIPRICSLTSDLTDVRLWSFYADSHRGAAIQIEISPTQEQLHRVRYSQGIPKYTNTILSASNISKILTEKTNAWEFESEYRVLCDDPYFPVPGMIREVHFGIRSDPQIILLIKNSIQNKYPLSRCHLDLNNSKIQKDPLKELRRVFEPHLKNE